MIVIVTVARRLSVSVSTVECPWRIRAGLRRGPMIRGPGGGLGVVVGFVVVELLAVLVDVVVVDVPVVVLVVVPVVVVLVVVPVVVVVVAGGVAIVNASTWLPAPRNSRPPPALGVAKCSTALSGYVNVACPVVGLRPYSLSALQAVTHTSPPAMIGGPLASLGAANPGAAASDGGEVRSVSARRPLAHAA
jgi:hypothetical protein